MDIRVGVNLCFDWISKYLTSFDNGRNGIYERIRANINERVILARPDTASEMIYALSIKKKAFNETDEVLYDHLVEWLKSVQNTDEECAGTFNFAFIDGKKEYSGCDTAIFQNDNAKIIINLLDSYEITKDKRLIDIASKCLDFWADNQTDEGYFHKQAKNMQPFPKATCFVSWMMLAMYMGYKSFGNEKYLISGKKASKYCKNLIVQGRVMASCEVDKTEFWRPLSSDNYIMLYCLSRIYTITQDKEVKDCIDEIIDFCDELIDVETGAIKNCTKETKHCTYANDENLCDLVYTEGFALNGLIELSKIKGYESYIEKAKKMANWLLDIQIVDGDKDYLKGSWRGSYNLKTKIYDGICDKSNYNDEGGVNSAYVGWCALPNIIGFMKIILLGA